MDKLTRIKKLLADIGMPHKQQSSVGPISAKRMLEINQMTSQVTCGKIFVTAFPNMATFKKLSDQLAWETEVWIAEMPDHMIHLNGDKFLGPR